MPAALAAGVMALATVLVVSLGPSGGGSPAADAGRRTGRGPPPWPRAMPCVRPRPRPRCRRAGAVVRDAQLDRYLRAHRDYATASPGSLPGGSGRSIATVSLER